MIVFLTWIFFHIVPLCLNVIAMTLVFGLFVAVTFKMVTGGVTAATTSVATITVGVGLLGVVVGIITILR